MILYCTLLCDILVQYFIYNYYFCWGWYDAFLSIVTKPRIWPNPDYDSILSFMTSIVTLTYLDIYKWRVALVRQEMLTRSGAPDFICLPFGWWIHFAMSFLPFLAFQPLTFCNMYKSAQSIMSIFLCVKKKKIKIPPFLLCIN